MYKKIFLYFKNGVFCDQYGQPITSIPSVFANEDAILCCTILNNDNTGVDLSESEIFSFAADNNYNHSDDLMILSESDKINVSGDWADVDLSAGKISIRISGRAGAFKTKLGASASINMFAQVKQLFSGAESIIASFQIKAVNIVHDDEGEPEASTPGYYTAAQVDALLQAATVYQFSADGSTSWHDTYASTDKYYRERVDITGSAWSAALPLGRSEVILDTKNYSFSTTDAQAAAINITKTTLGIASDSEPQVSLWLVGTGTKTKVADSSYTAVWNADSLTITYYTTWSAGDWILKMS